MSTTKLQTLKTISGNTLLDSKGGNIIQIQTGTMGFARQTITSTLPVAVSGLSATITPTSTTSKILILAQVTSSWTYVCGCHIYRNGSELIANHGGTNQTGGATAYIINYGITLSGVGDGSADKVYSQTISYLDLPLATTPQTYQIYMNSGWNGGSNALYINDRASQDMLGTSYITLMEIT